MRQVSRETPNCKTNLPENPPVSDGFRFVHNSKIEEIREMARIDLNAMGG
jgi:hypothetical protein